MLTDEHDEMLFVVIHQASELWLKLAAFELRAAVREVSGDNLRQAFKIMSRIKTILSQLTQSWDILSTLTPVDYLKFRDSLGQCVGLPVVQLSHGRIFAGEQKRTGHSCVRKQSRCPRGTGTDAQCAWTIRRRDQAPCDAWLAHYQAILTADVAQPYAGDESVLAAWLHVYKNPDEFYDL